ncbi:MAG TPA: hypothetical protein PLP34_08680, partial [Chitinophagaceae bacterium]|nr:hypothetical protein [Chitinophagaceae bacterium]
MKLINFLFIWCVLQVSVNAQSVSELISQAQKLELQKNESAALEKYKQALLTDKHNLDALCGASFMCARIGNRETNSDKKNAYFRTAKVFAEEAMKINPNSSNANYMMAVAMGRIALISGPRDKVAASRDIKKYASAAVKLDPAQRGAWHVLGKYNY